MSNSGALSKLKEESLHYLYWLEMFKNKVNESNDLYYKLQLLFLAWFDNLSLIQKEYLPETENKGGNDYDIVEKFKSCSNSISEFISSKVNTKFEDEILNEEIKNIHSLLEFFQEVCKIYYDFQPAIDPTMTAPNFISCVNTRKQFPKIVQLLAEKIDLPENECATLADIPPTFPTFKFSYTMLLGELIGIEKTTTCEEAALISKYDQNQLPLFCPSPSLLANHPSFVQLKETQKTLISKIQAIHEMSNKQASEIIEQLTNYNKSIELLNQTIKIEAPPIIESLSQTFKSYLDITEQKRENSFLTQLRNEVQSTLEITAIQNFSEFEEKFIETDPEDVQELLTNMKNAKESIEKENKELQNLIISKDRKLQLNERVIHTHETRSSILEIPLDNLPDKLSKHSINILNTLEFLSIPPPIERCFKINNSFLSDEFIESLTIQPGVQGWHDNCINYLSHCVREKQDLLNSLQIELNQINNFANVLKESSQTLTKKKNKEAPFCRSCETLRMFCICSCGHTFCEGCYREMVAALPHVCKYCGKAFQQTDVVQINW
ncbi:hypothetical protein TVAG_334520 [Trichomonas vaginalis G3]|uniref:RING-type domain-containing protein n=1 Tax=Trichomonas vaginalis (strain ATCC PRA-98 / G3) TaxID=412133 RepID=A2FQS8_TRIV3|nr:RING/U-box family [Trichomonas vaginalis G3]EAX92749.1 hypothetical protein TVAG_334520 [Trichomonas vaginalis G3]KAI5515562.1 RING/U-box family [Trichomonas vaginalis G3]|eukprot:XP_001305679.1 hypothetical protein [Trichomonas vaginalis G3]